MKMIESTGVELKGKTAAVIGRDKLGRPVALLLLNKTHGEHLPFIYRRSC